MRNFIISLICLTVAMGAWTAFSIYSAKTSDKIQMQTERLVTHSIVQGDWNEAEIRYRELEHMWKKYRKTASIFFDSKDINDIDCTMGKAYFYMKAEDISNSSGEFCYLKDKFRLLHANDSITLLNIF